jgi:hypothetical protein
VLLLLLLLLLSVILYVVAGWLHLTAARTAMDAVSCPSDKLRLAAAAAPVWHGSAVPFEVVLTFCMRRLLLTPFCLL